MTTVRYRSGRRRGWRGGRSLDDAAVYRAVGGERMPLTAAERTDVIARMLAEGVSNNEVARRLGVSWETVQRHRRRIRREVEVAQVEDRLMAQALQLADDIRADRPAAHRTVRVLERLELEQLCCVLAAMVDPAVPLSQMAWWRLDREAGAAA